MGVRPGVQGRLKSGRLCQRNVAPDGVCFKAYHRLVEFPQYLVVLAGMECRGVVEERLGTMANRRTKLTRLPVDLDVKVPPSFN